MKEKNFTTIDGNEAVAYVAYRINEVISIYPITPSSNMAEWADAWAAEGKTNIWGTIPRVVEMQSEGGASGALHGAIQSGALGTTFTASQGLLLMIPNMFKIAGELTPVVIHVSARTVATHALSIFGDHSDVMAVRSTGFGLMASASVQEAMDFALIAQAASLDSRIPFLHFFDGFRTSHEVSKIEVVPDDVMRRMLDTDKILEHRKRALSPDHPVIRGTAQNPDVFFQARETCNPYYNACADIVQQKMNEFASQTGREYHLFDYHGAKDAERVIILMASGCEPVHETVDHLLSQGEKVGVLKVRLYRPFDMKRFVDSLPATVQKIAVLDRTKEPGSPGEPLYLDCVNAFHEAQLLGWGSMKNTPKIIGGRYGLSSKEFTPAMIKGVFDHLDSGHLKNHFTIGIKDDVTHLSLPYDPQFSTESNKVTRAIFYGLGSDGTVGANKNSIKIIGENTDNYAQGYFVYDSKKAGAVTVSHLRFGSNPIHSTYLISQANFVACHQNLFLEKYDMLSNAADKGTFLLNSPYGPNEVWNHLPKEVQETIIAKKMKFYVIDAYKVAKETGMGQRINTIMQVCFFAISGVLPKNEAIEEIKKAIKKTYGKKGDDVVKKNMDAVDQTLAHLSEVKVPNKVTSTFTMPPAVAEDSPVFVKEVLGEIIAGRGDLIPVSKFPADGTFPTATSQYEKRNIALEIPVWDPATCIQCGKCSIVCPHGVIRMKTYDPKLLEKAPPSFKSADVKAGASKGMKCSIQVSPEDCTGCSVCTDACPAKNKTDPSKKAINMAPQPPLRAAEKENWKYFLSLPDADPRLLKTNVIREQQLMRPLFEFSGACGGCGETPYLKLISQLFGDRMIASNATGCSSIYGGNLPTTPWAVNAQGRGPAWSNSLFEDNAEFGFGFRLTIDKMIEFSSELLMKLSSQVGQELADFILKSQQKTEAEIYEQRERVAELKKILEKMNSPEAKHLLAISDMLVKKSVWILGGDGWAYDIGYGGLDHVLSSGRNVNMLVLDTEVYSNTGGQMSKSTPRAAVAKFAAAGKPAPKKDLGLMAMTYGTVYVARISIGARDDHALKAILEAEAYEGPSLIIAYSHCIAHGIDMAKGLQNEKAAVASGQWPLYRFNPDRIKTGENPFQLDSKDPEIPVEKYLNMETRFKMLGKTKPEEMKHLFAEAQEDVNLRWALYKYLSTIKFPAKEEGK
ncbi:MAG: pyruvate:ferredoxin (flavodoxin) oxidoreductase [Candidatus Aureabacteria bacterium]|nr:pyruvate:ferredoxin (flavodoxin) oxidoreductase [Candidatus Auribacterota bacterium]